MSQNEIVQKDKKFINKVLRIGGVERDVLVRRYEKYVWTIINKKIGAGGEVAGIRKDDLFQYVFLKLFERDQKPLRDYIVKYEIPFKNYLSLFCSSRITDFLRKEQKINTRYLAPPENDQGEDQGMDSFENDAPSPQNQVLGKEFLLLLEKFSGSLKEKDQEIFRLMLEGHSSGDISKETGLAVSKIYKRIFNIKQRLKEYMKEVEGVYEEA